MRQFITICLLSVLCIISVHAQTSTLKFNTDGEFKIVQFSDVHYKVTEPGSQPAKDIIANVLDYEKPDLVIFTGDTVYGAPVLSGLETILKIVQQRHIPYAVTWGNHDSEFDKSRAEIQAFVERQPYNIGFTPENISGYSNFVLPIAAAATAKEAPAATATAQTSGKVATSSTATSAPAAVIYCFDTHERNKIDDVLGYDWIHSDQIEWYKQNSRMFTKNNGGKPLYSLAYFHIAFPEYKEAALNDKCVLYGNRMESIGCPQINSGLFAAMKECGDIRATFAGHDHDNNFIVKWYGIYLGQGQCSGAADAYYHVPGPRGGRVVVLKEGSEAFTTWIRYQDGTASAQMTFE